MFKDSIKKRVMAHINAKIEAAQKMYDEREAALAEQAILEIEEVHARLSEGKDKALEEEVLSITGNII